MDAPSEMLFQLGHRRDPQDQRRLRQALVQQLAVHQANAFRNLAHLQLIQIVFLCGDVGVAEAEDQAEDRRRPQQRGHDDKKHFILHFSTPVQRPRPFL